LIVAGKAGRPTAYTEELADEICERVSEGVPLAQICREAEMPGLRTVYDWMEAKPDFSARIARARDSGHDMIAQDTMRIADTQVQAVIEKYEVVSIPNPHDPNGDPVEELRCVERRVEDALGHRKLQVETRLKLLAKWAPKKYGDKVSLEHAGPGGGAIHVATIDAAKLSDATLQELLSVRRAETESG
jgi:hypothetical protein